MRTRSTLFALAAGLLIGVAKAFLPVVFLAPLSSFAQAPGTAPASTAGVIEADKLPIVLEGQVDAEGYGAVVGSWRVVVEEKRPDGAIRGRMTYKGKVCVVNDASFDGTFDGKNIKLNMPFDQRIPYCRDWVYQLAWNEPRNRFEGTYATPSSAGSLMTLRLTLVPVPK